jgi:MFS superfamily sulfate permease-like transporter
MADAKKRHGCLTTWLVLTIMANSATVLMYVLRNETIRRSLPNAPGWALPVLIIFALFNLVCAVALLQWKKWGFWGFCASAVASLVVNLWLGVGMGMVGAVIGVLLLYGVLHIGKENKGWPRLE